MTDAARDYLSDAAQALHRMERFEDPNDVLNSTAYHTGKPCIEPGCDRPAGTHWSHLWCQPCNAERMRRITSTLHDMTQNYRLDET